MKVDFEVGLQRALQRDSEQFGSPQRVHTRYLKRYYPAQRLYLQAARPEERADVVLDNNHFQHPQLFFRPA